MSSIAITVACEARAFVETMHLSGSEIRDLVSAIDSAVLIGAADGIDGLHLWAHNGGIGLAVSPALAAERFVRAWASERAVTTTTECAFCKAQKRCHLHGAEVRS